MEELKIIDVSMSDEQKHIDDIRLEFYDTTERYYIGLESNPHEKISVLFPNLDWIRKNYSDKNHLITYESLNEGRRNQILNYEKAIKYNCPMWNVDKIDDNGNIKQYRNNKNEIVDYKLDELSLTGAKQFQKEIDKGLYTLYKLVR